MVLRYTVSYCERKARVNLMKTAETTSKMNIDAGKLLGVTSLAVKVGLKAASARSVGTAVGLKAR